VLIDSNTVADAAGMVPARAATPTSAVNTAQGVAMASQGPIKVVSKAPLVKPDKSDETKSYIVLEGDVRKRAKNLAKDAGYTRSNGGQNEFWLAIFTQALDFAEAEFSRQRDEATAASKRKS
jgi:hypothetical protein